MNFTHTICWDQQLIYLRFSGELSLRKLLAAGEQLTAEVEEMTGFKFLIDLSGAELRSDFREWRLISRLLRRRNYFSSTYYALLVTKNIDTALCLMIIQKAKLDPYVEVFSTFSGACSHLGLRGEALDQLKELSLQIPSLASNQHELTISGQD